MYRQRERIRQVIGWMVILALCVTAFVPPAAGMQSVQRSSYIVQGESAEQAARLVGQVGGEVSAHLEIIAGVGAWLTPRQAAALGAQPGIRAISPNAGVQLVGEVAPVKPNFEDGDLSQLPEQSITATLKKAFNEGAPGINSGVTIPATDYPDVIGADLAWQAGVNGSGVTVAVLDTGFGIHPSIFLNVNGGLRNRVLAWKDFVQRKLLPLDPNGHGTHVAGVIADSLTGADGEWNGVAPGVSLVGVRVLDEQGHGNYEKVIQGLQWVVNHKDQYNIRIINLSLVSEVQSPYWADPLNQAVMAAWQAGIVVIAAAGNTGPDPLSVGVPGNNPYVITVGAFTDAYTPEDWSDDYLAEFSAAGPTLDGFVKPDLLAPGAHMVAPMLRNTYLGRSHQANRVGSAYFSMAGTSQAAAVVSGVAALILSAEPDLTPDQVKYRLMVTSMPWINPETDEALYSMWQQGTGRVNAFDAVYAGTSESANAGMDLGADLAGTTHYEGFSYYDEEIGAFRLAGDYGTWGSGYGVWAGGYGVWAGGYGVWAGGYGVWAGNYPIWSGGYGVWAGGYGVWAGGYGVWAGGYGVWAGGYGVWAGNVPWDGTIYADPAYVDAFMAGVSPNASTSMTTINSWVEEP